MTTRSEVTAGRTASDVMTRRLVTVHPDDSLLAACELLTRGEFRHLPVVGHDGRCLAVVDDGLLAAQWFGNPFAQPRRRIADVMPSRVHCVHEDTTLARIAEIMWAENVTAVPVVDERMVLLGIVTDRDLVAAVAASVT